MELTSKAYGALAIAVLRGLKKDGKLDKASFPSLETLLQGITGEELAKEKGAKAWHMEGEVCREDQRDPAFSLTPIWKEYRSYLKGVPEGPMRGPSWDICNWSEADKRAFQFDFMDSDI